MSEESNGDLPYCDTHGWGTWNCDLYCPRAARSLLDHGVWGLPDPEMRYVQCPRDPRGPDTLVICLLVADDRPESHGGWRWKSIRVRASHIFKMHVYEHERWRDDEKHSAEVDLREQPAPLAVE